ncbi:MAG: hypothetical protein ACE5OR_09225 [bacterium]
MLVRLFPQSVGQWEQLRAMDLVIVSEIPSPEVVDVLVTPSQLSEIEALGVRSQVLMDAQAVRQAAAEAMMTIDPEFHTYDEMTAELDSLAQAFPEIARLESIGLSPQEGRTIWPFKISDNVHTEEDEPAVM